MDARVSSWPLQTGTPTPTPTPTATPNGTGANVTNALTAPEMGLVGTFLREVGIPYARPVGAAITFFITLFVLYTLGRAVVVPFVNRILNRRGLEAHAKRPLLRLTRVIVVVIVLFIAFRVAGYGKLLTSLAAIAAAATLAIGFALQDTLANFAAGLFIYIDRPFRIGDWIEWPVGAGRIRGSWRISPSGSLGYGPSLTSSPP